MTRSTVLARRLLAVAATVGLAVALLPAAPASAAVPSQRVSSGFFGMHDGDPLTWPTAPVGEIRLWDSGVTWRQIETANGVFNFSRLDAEVASAQAHHSRVLLVLGQTPRFHSTRPGKGGAYGLGASSMPTQSSWLNYVYKVVKRYKGKGVDYQVWNEANVAGYWSGTPAQMAKLTQWTSGIVNRNDSSAKVVSPALATRLSSQRLWLRTFYAQRTGGKRVGAYVDVVSLNLYPVASGSPEQSMTLLAAARTMLRQAGVSKPVWNTEINYGLLGGGSARKISSAKSMSYVARTLVLNAENNVKRTFWYAWDLQHLANTRLTYANGTSLAPAGQAYTVVRSWLLNSRTKGCARDSKGTWTCTLAYSGGIKRIYWNPSRKVYLRVVRSAHFSIGIGGVRRSLSGGSQIGVGITPILVGSSR
jgi:polysaccharide biosynthesis protein PslG